MMAKSNNWAEKIENYNLQDEIDSLKKENTRLKKKNLHFKSTKAYSAWKKYVKVKNKITKSKECRPKVKNIKDIKVAILADEFTFNCFKYEFIALPVSPKNWKKVFELENPDLFFCESAWRGYDGERNNLWRYKIPEVFNSRHDTNRIELFAILDYCKEHNIPTIFWNKEDPFHYKNEKISYADTASHFDYIFTSSKECIEQYKKDFNHPNVSSLMFAGQSKIFNPMRLNDLKEENVVFAGAYYPNHPERSAMMEVVLDKIIDQWDGKLKIFDRVYYETWAGYPDRYSQYKVPPIPYVQTAEEYRKANWGLNFNTITDSETMFARRVFELALCYTFIITNYSLGVEKIFGDNVFIFDDVEELPDFNYENEEMKLENLYNVLENHTYTIRWKQILDTIGMKYKEDSEKVNCVFYVDDSEDIKNVVENFKCISHSKKYLKLVVNDDNFSNDDVDRVRKEYKEIDRIFFKTDDINEKIASKSNTDYIIFVEGEIGPDFIKHALLHYQYLNKRIAIGMSDDKFRLDVEDSLTNKLVPKRVYKEFFEKNKEVEVYYI